LNEREAAKRLRISARNLWGRRNRGEVPFVRIGRKVLYRVETIARIAAEWEGQGKVADAGTRAV